MRALSAPSALGVTMDQGLENDGGELTGRPLPALVGHVDLVVAEVDAMLHRRFREPLRLADVAAQVGLSAPI